MKDIRLKLVYNEHSTFGYQVVDYRGEGEVSHVCDTVLHELFSFKRGDEITVIISQVNHKDAYRMFLGTGRDFVSINLSNGKVIEEYLLTALRANVLSHFDVRDKPLYVSLEIG